VDPAEARSLFEKALSLAPDRRAQFLADPQISSDVREEVLALLRADQGAETFFRETVEGERPAISGVGERFGPFETVELLGRGGMGAVFKAERVDGELRQTVAIKVVDRAWFKAHALERFRQERQILAGLMHANIARLIDGGTRSDGIAYLAMEYVDGLRLDQYCEQGRLSIEDRLRLFLPLCEAVDYAHQKLIIHRDLKPSNVLVTTSGEPKLLDFGIAKVLDTSAGFQTQTLVLTPDFASPEQARGEDVTLATDVYGLGSILYFLLTGRAPHTTKGGTAEEVRQAICADPERPSLLRPELKGDLENIVMKALHVEPERRYRSALELAADLQNFLSWRPVRATPDRWTYRAGRFVQRYRFATAAAAIAMIAVAVGTGASVYEAHRAQQRFSEVRELANRFMFDFEASIHDTPGTLAARRKVASTARQYLSELAADAGNDPGLRRELAESYDRLALIEYDTGEVTQAMRHVQTTMDILHALKDDCCGAPAQRRLYLDASNILVDWQSDGGSLKDAEKLSYAGLATARNWISQMPHDPLAGPALVRTLTHHGALLSRLGRAKEARPILEEAVQRSDEVVRQNPGEGELAFAGVEARNRLALALSSVGEPAAALDVEHTALATLDPLIQGHPENTRWRIRQIGLHTSISLFLQALAKKDPSLKPQVFAEEAKAYTLAKDNLQHNGDNKRMLDDAAVLGTRYANRLSENGRMSEAVPLLQEAAGDIDELIKLDPDDFRNYWLRFNNRLNLGYTLMQLNRWRDASEVLKEGEEYGRQTLEKRPDDIQVNNSAVGILMCRVKTERMLGHKDEARRLCQRALAAASDQMIRNSQDKNPVSNIELLREEARLLGVPDTTLKLQTSR
jgi:tetratricopeptide (TPR) repeat protein/tRNA A-37 threonylcarbamoyl transferase component Bud32